MAELKVRFEILTPREREVMAFVVSGRLNKQTAESSRQQATANNRHVRPDWQTDAAHR
jgi:FixJ family two-component response regulator